MHSSYSVTIEGLRPILIHSDRGIKIGNARRTVRKGIRAIDRGRTRASRVPVNDLSPVGQRRQARIIEGADRRKGTLEEQIRRIVSETKTEEPKHPPPDRKR